MGCARVLAIAGWPPLAPACLYKTEGQVTIKACGACDWVTSASLRPVRRDAAKCKNTKRTKLARKEQLWNTSNFINLNNLSTLLCDSIDTHCKFTNEDNKLRQRNKQTVKPLWIVLFSFWILWIQFGCWVFFVVFLLLILREDLLFTSDFIQLISPRKTCKNAALFYAQEAEEPFQRTRSEAIAQSVRCHRRFAFGRRPFAHQNGNQWLPTTDSHQSQRYR